MNADLTSQLAGTTDVQVATVKIKVKPACDRRG